MARGKGIFTVKEGDKIGTPIIIDVQDNNITAQTATMEDKPSTKPVMSNNTDVVNKPIIRKRL